MKVSKKEHRIISRALNEWQDNDQISNEDRQRLSSTFEIVMIDWTQIAKYSFAIAVTCIVFSTLSVLFDDWLVALIQEVFSAPEIAKSCFFAVGAIGFYLFGVRRKQRFPDKVLANEALFVLGMISTALSIFFLGKVIETENLTVLLLFASLIYGVIGLWLPSQIVWGFALITLGGWFGLHTYQSEVDGYYLGMNFPLRFVLFGVILLSISQFVLVKWQKFDHFQLTSKVVGLLCFFVSLWLVSVFGNHVDFSVWLDIEQVSLLYWAALLLIASLVTFYLGTKYHDDIAKGVALAFLFINLYTRFFEYLWEGMHKALFFAILAVSFWLLGTQAEKLYQGNKAIPRK